MVTAKYSNVKFGCQLYLALFLCTLGFSLGFIWLSANAHLAGYSAIMTCIGDNSGDTSFRFVDRSLRAAAPISRML